MKSFRVIWLATLVVVFVLPGVSLAQDNSTEPAFQDFKADESQVLGNEDINSLSGHQMLTLAQSKIARMRATLKSTKSLLEKVRKHEKDIEKINCINEKLAPLKGFLKVSEQSYVSLKGAVGRKDMAASRHHYTLIAIAAQKIKNLGAESRACAGEEEIRYAKGTHVKVHISSQIASEKSPASGEAELVLARLPQLTPYQ